MQIAFFPWLRLRAPLTMDDFTFIPFLNHDGTVHQAFADLSEGLTSILHGYVDMQGRPIENCVIVTSAQRQPVWDLHDEDHERISKYAKILIIAAFSKNEYNTNIGCYSNTTHFQFVRQRFTLPVDFITYVTRRRDGSTMNGGYRHSQIRFPVPPQAQSASDICIDIDFASSIASALAANSEVAYRLLAAMLYFDIANTDSDVIRQEAEIILMASAYERLLDIE